jgi:hypothetical protein
MLEEFTDVSETEKVFMKRWNVFAETDVVIPDSSVEALVKRFAEENKTWIKEEEGVREEFVKHCLNLWDNAVLTGKGMEKIMAFIGDAGGAYLMGVRVKGRGDNDSDSSSSSDDDVE